MECKQMISAQLAQEIKYKKQWINAKESKIELVEVLWVMTKVPGCHISDV
jgi:hypothetical protein